MKNNFRSFLLLTSAVLTFACGSASVDTVASNTVQSSQIYQDYRISSDRSQTKITATFRVGGSTGTTVELAAPGKILYNGSPMTFSPPGEIFKMRTKGTTYETTLPNYEAANKFEFTAANGKTYTNSINLPPIQIAAQKPLVLQKSKVSTIPLSRPVAADEKLSLGVNDDFGDEIPAKNSSIFFNPSRNAVVIAPPFWKAKPLPAKIQIKIKISKTVSVAQATPTGGAMFAEYSAAPLNAVLGKSAGSNANTNVAAANNADALPEDIDAATNPDNSSANKSKRIIIGRKRSRRR